jgi:hypothetical protein
VLAGAKPFETRGWAPPAALVGRRLAVHAGLKVVRALPEELARAVADVLGRDWADEVPRGRLLCTAVLRGAWRTGGALDGGLQATTASLEGSPALPAFRPDPFGDYAPGRWIWGLDAVRALTPQPPLRGRQGIWCLPEELAAIAA